MIKRFLLTFSLIAMLNLIAIGQDCPPKELIDVFNNCYPELGNDTSCVLNEFESDFLNLLYQNERGTFNFTGKRVAFFAGINGAGKITKEQYFSTLFVNFQYLQTKNGTNKKSHFYGLFYKFL